VLTTDRVAGVALVLVALVTLAESRALPLGTVGNPDPPTCPSSWPARSSARSSL
jgi:hypothetical protein